MRLDKLVCKSTQLNRAQAHNAIHAGLVIVNGVAELSESAQVHENNTITLKGEPLKARPFRYLLIHKPVGTICSNIDEVYPSLFTGLNLERSAELHVAGRLDADTTGLVLVTDDGRWSFEIIRPEKHCKKVYRIGLSQAVSEGKAAELAAQFNAGVQLQGEAGLTRPAQFEMLGIKQARLTITEGKYHQVKRMLAAVGNRVVSLHREKVGRVTLDIGVGQWRYLTAAEVASFIGDA